ncbi:MAG TPA: ribosome silencing factor [Pyrinomonadaceae bacterium]|nr:ribosome silencing factor [Pyrinomonadaceae bacterium]
MPESREHTEKERGREAHDEGESVGSDATPEQTAFVAATYDELDERVRLALHAASEKKALDLVVLDLRAVASFTDFFLIASGANVRQVQAIADGVVEQLRKALLVKPARVEGYNSAEWVLLDYGDFVFHVFEEKSRRFYDLERLWRDGARVALPPEIAGGEGSLRTER